jgi:hypothetical protein
MTREQWIAAALLLVAGLCGAAVVVFGGLPV